VTGPLSNIVDFIEPLQWIPTSTRSRGRRLHDGIVEVYGAMIMRVKARMDAGEDVPDCLVKTLLLNQEQEKLDWEDLCMLAVAFNLGGIHSVLINNVPLWGSTNPGCTVHRLRVLSCGSWLSSHHTQKFKLEPMRSLTAWLAEMVGRAQRTASAFRTSGP
jgi:hypothetical protein